MEFKILLHQRLCQLINDILYYYNPCNIKDNSCTMSPDITNDPIRCCFKTHYDRSAEDRSCHFIEDGKCTYDNVFCKLFLCITAINKTDPKCVESLKALEVIAKLHDLTRRPFIGQRYVGQTEEINR